MKFDELVDILGRMTIYNYGPSDKDNEVEVELLVNMSSDEFHKFKKLFEDD